MANPIEETRVKLSGITTMQAIGVLAAIGGLGGFFYAVSSKAVEHPWQSYLYGFMVWTVLAFGCLSISLLIHMTRGKWGYSFIRVMEAGSKTVLLMAVLFIPILAFLKDIYPWANPELVAESKTMQHRAALLNLQWFAIRSAVYFGIWIVLAFVLSKWSKDEDRTGDVNYLIKRTNLAAPGAVVLVLTVNFAVTDWVMSLEQHWYSTIFGLIFVAGGALMALALSATYLGMVWKREPFTSLLGPKNFHDIGNLLFTLVVFWAYLAFSQFLITWSGNLPEEIIYYANRKEGPWMPVGTGIILLHFFLPFLLLLSARLKRTPSMLLPVAIWIFLIRIAEVTWEVLPSFHRTGVQFSWVDLAAVIGIGGIWFAVFGQILKATNLLPRYLQQPSEVAEHA